MVSLGVDIGGTGCKCVAFRHSGEQLAIAYTEYAIPVGSVNLAPGILQEAVFQVIGKCVEQLPDSGEVAAITLSSFGESFVAIDEAGQPLTDILLYFGNTESEEFDRLVEKVGQETFMRITRLQPVAIYSLSKMLYTRKIASRPVYKYLFIAGFLGYRLSGKACTDISLACRSLLYDVENRCWSAQLLEQCGIDEKTLPEVVPYGAVIGDILPEAARELGLPETVKIVMGTHDQIVNALGAGVENVGEAVDTSGTCECLTPLFADLPENMDFLRSNFACVPYPEDKGFVTYAFNISAGSVIRWYRDALAACLQAQAEEQGKSIYDLLNEQSPGEPTKLMVLPFLQGMGGTPDVDAGATGLIAGMTTQTRLPNIYRAFLEGITFEMRYNQELLEQNGVKLDKLFVCGGGARSAVWLQIKADILGCEILPVKCEETGALGSAVLGFAAVTGESPFAIAKKFRVYGEPVKPNPAHQIVYHDRYNSFKALRKLYTDHKEYFEMR